MPLSQLKKKNVLNSNSWGILFIAFVFLVDSPKYTIAFELTQKVQTKVRIGYLSDCYQKVHLPIESLKYE